MSRTAIPLPDSKTVVRGAVSLAVAAALIGWGLPWFAHTSWTAIWSVIGRVPLSHAGGFQLLMILGLWCYTFTITGSLPGIGHLKALVVNLCGSSVGNVLPAGGAAGLAATYTICRSWGFSRRAISTSAVVSGVWNVVARVALPVVAILALWTGNHAKSQVLDDAAIAGAASGLAIITLFAAMLVSEPAMLAVGRLSERLLRPLFRRLGRMEGVTVSELLLDTRRRCWEVVRYGWWRMTLGLLGFFGMYYLLFVLIMRDVGLSLFHGQMFAAFAIGRLMTAVGVTPGGLGLTEVATVAALTGWGANPADATAGVLLFTVFTHLAELPLGAIAWAGWSMSPKHDFEHEDEIDPVGDALSD